MLKMSRLKHFTRSLISSYAFLGVNVFYTLASVPLALVYLSKAEFGLWALTLQIAGYISMVDLGLSSSIGRILIDYKDRRADGSYGGFIKSSFLVGAVQGSIVLLVGMSLVWFMASWLRVPAELSDSFFWLMTGQVLITAASFISRMFGQILVAWQRIDVFNHSQILQLVTGFAALWLGFHWKMGVFSLLLGAVVGWIFSTVMCAVACRSLGLWPRAEEWGRMSWQQFRELFSYGMDVFLIAVGSQLIVSSQVVLVSRQLGMEAAASWSVMTKAFTLVGQIVWRIIGNAMPAFAEMHVRQEHERFWTRYSSLFVTVNVFAGFCAVLFAACNGQFVSVWTSGRFTWPSVNDALLGTWLVILAQQCCFNSLIVCLKKIGRLKYVYIAEGVVFIAITFFLLGRTGITGLLVTSVVATVAFTWAYGLQRIGKLIDRKFINLFWEWQLPMLRVIALMALVWLVDSWLLRSADDLVRLAVNGSSLTIVGLWASLRYALSPELVAELIAKLPSSLHGLASYLTKHACRKSQKPV